MRLGEKQAPGMGMANPEAPTSASRRPASERPPALHTDLPSSDYPPPRSDLPLWTTVALGLVTIAAVIAYALL